MQITGNHLLFPRNFLFLHRLPARFSILVIGKGAVSPSGTAYELEVNQQRLVLKSKAELKPGVVYELEKTSGREFKIIRELATETVLSTKAEEKMPATREHFTDALAMLMADVRTNLHDVLALKVLADSGRTITVQSGKFQFNLSSEFNLSGVFVTNKSGGFTLFIAGSALKTGDGDAMATLLGEVGVAQVRHVNQAVLDRIAVGAIDLSS